MVSGCELRAELPATLQASEALCLKFREWSRDRVSRSGGFIAELLVREALVNAVVHGCGTDPERRIQCVLRLKGDRLLITIADDGSGFDWRRIVSSGPCSATQSCGRGLEILRKYANRVRYNAGGNVVTIFKRFLRGEQ